MATFKVNISNRRPWKAVTMSALVLSGAIFAIAGTTDLDSNKAKAPVEVQVDNAPLPRTESGEFSFSPIVQRVTPSVVKVVVRQEGKEVSMPGQSGLPFDDPMLRRFFGQIVPDSNNRTFRTPPSSGLGSGVIVSSDGYILTNNHVIADADKVTVTLGDGREFPAKVVGRDEKTDLAVIKVDAGDLPAITFASSDDIQVGDRVLAVGNPFGLGQTVTTGIVSATGRALSMGIDYEDFIQTDAAINPGNSGGALVDMRGRLIGINTAIFSRSGGFQGIGFAIPSQLARQVMDGLVQYGKVTRGYLGVAIQDLTPALAEQFGLKSRKGVLIGEVKPDSPGDKAGLEGGDVVLSWNGKDVEDSRRLKFAVAATKPGETVDARILRDGEEKTISVKVGEMPGDKAVASNTDRSSDEGVLNGVGVADLTQAVRSEFEIPAKVEGAVITQVDPASAAAEAGLSPGDVILEINRKPVRSADDAIRLTEDFGDGKTLVKLWSRGGTHYLVVDESNRKGS
ncbi:MAG TPA: DegQ family serine endoprotease [Opitutaceae bacterium]